MLSPFLVAGFCLAVQPTLTVGQAPSTPASGTFVPPAEAAGVAVWSCDATGATCKASPDVFDAEQGDIASWDFAPGNFADDCSAMDYDMDPSFPEGIAASACTWMSGCKTAECEGKCVANVFQELNDQATYSPGQLDRESNAIYRDTPHVWGLSCSLLASQVFRDAATQAGSTPRLTATSDLLAPGMGCPSDEDIDSVAAQMATRKQEYQEPDLPYNTAADTAVWPFSYQAKMTEPGGAITFVGDAPQAKEFLKDRCATAIVSNKLMEYVIHESGWEYSDVLKSQGYHIAGLDDDVAAGMPINDTGVTLCRENQGMLEELLRQSVARPGEAAKVQEAIEDLPAGACMGITYASKIDSSQPWLSHGVPGSCHTEVEASLREIYNECAKITTKEECVMARFEGLQKTAVSFLNAHHSEVSTGELTDTCMVSMTNPWTGELHAPHSSQNAAMGTAVQGGAEAGETEAVGTATSSGVEVVGTAVSSGVGEGGAAYSSPEARRHDNYEVGSEEHYAREPWMKWGDLTSDARMPPAWCMCCMHVMWLTFVIMVFLSCGD